MNASIPLALAPALTVALSFLALPAGAAPSTKIRFPEVRPEGACWPRPHPGAVLDVSPPGFCWWPAARRGAVRYRVRVTGEKGATAYESPLIDDPAHAPAQVLPPGLYHWTVDALDARGAVAATRAPESFRIGENAFPQPWLEAKELLGRVPRAHPRLLFPKATLDAVRATLGTTRREAYEALRRSAEGALKIKPPEEPDYDRLTDASARRVAYGEAFAGMRKVHDGAMVHLALMSLLSGERKYGDVARAILVETTRWDVEGISSVMAPHGDEIGLGIARAGAQAYDWLYDTFSPDERARVRAMLVARADQMLRRLEKRDYLARPEESHAGRLVGYLIEHAIALAEEPRAVDWLDYALRAAFTVFPHWAGGDGGWAEGMSYGLAYNTIYLAPLEALRQATDLDLWRRPFYRAIRSFFIYNLSPLGEVAPWGDGEENGVPGRASGIRALLQFHALRYRDPSARGWIELLRDERGRSASIAPLPGIFLPDDVAPRAPVDLPPDAAFFGVGWAAMHTDLARPECDLMVLFKASPYGAVSHGHADQNTFVILKGGRALAMPAGAYYPTYGSPFHAEYTRQTAAHNGILIDGRGQVVRQGSANGALVAFESRPHLGYACGDAAAAYGGSLERFRRHVVLARPSLVVIADDLAAARPAEYRWLLHAPEQFELVPETQTLVSRRGDASMTVHLATRGGFGFEQTDEWPLPPKTGYPMSRKPEPRRQWHFAAATRQPAAQRRIAAVMLVAGEQGAVRRVSPDEIEARAHTPEGVATVRVRLDPDEPILDARFEPVNGPVESIRAVR